MCGIYGFYGLEDKALLDRMGMALRHRGPDDSGTYTDNKISLGNQRLSIIDIKGGHQPISNEDASIWITYSGEIYNYRELRDELLEIGHKFNTRSDTEVILHCYIEYGEKCLDKLNGMFAFVIWDSIKKRLFLARDRLGIKPLYYFYNEGIFLFGSEIKSILEYDAIDRKIDMDSFNLFFSFRYDAGPRTIFEGVRKLMPGHYLVLENKKIIIKRYWDINFKINNRPEKFFMKKIETLLHDSVKNRLQSEVPIGIFLSGGVDSGSVVAKVDECGHKKIKTFTLGFNEKNDEISDARRISEHFNTDHHELFINEDVIKHLPKIIYHLDEPHADTTVIPTYFLSKFCKRHVTVLLTGEGADENFAGYEQYKMMKAMNFTRPLSIPRLKTNGLSLIGRMIGAASNQNIAFRYNNIISIFTPDEKRSLFSDKTQKRINIKDDYDLIKKHFIRVSHPLNKMLYFDTKVMLPQLLMKLDKMTMANAVEARVPFLDHRMVELAASIPPGYKLKGFSDKYILRESMKKKLPREIFRRKKQRFFTPIDSWFDRGIKDLFEETLEDKEISSYFNKQFTNKMMNYKHFSEYKLLLKFNSKSRIYYSRKLWNIIVFGLWYKQFIKKVS